jgi:hypothetical protein
MHQTSTPSRREFLRREPPELHALAGFVHGALAALHTLGALYNYRRKNWRDVAVHVAAAAYDMRSVRHHHRMQQLGLRAALPPRGATLVAAVGRSRA